VTVVTAMALLAASCSALGDRRASPTTLAPSPGSRQPGPAYTSQPERRYLTIGTNDGSQFTEEAYADIAANYDVVVFAKFHAGWDVARHHEATRRLKELNPDLEVYAYMSTKYWFNGFDWGEDAIDPAWFLRDRTGAVIPVTKESQNPDSKELGSYVDVTNPDYRAWIVAVARRWMAAAPYDGVRFDAADPVGDFGPRDVRRWEDLLEPGRVEAYNEGIVDLLREADDALAPGRVLFNGISPSPIRGPSRNLELLGVTDGAMDENFCVDADGQFHDLEADVAIMEGNPGKRLQLRAAVDPDALDPERLATIRRVCVGTFLLGWQPGASSLNLGRGYGLDQLGHQPPELDANLGAPLGPHTRDGDVLIRPFERGRVVVNLGTEPAGITLPTPVVALTGGGVGPAETGVTVPPGDAAILLEAALVAPAGS